MLWLFRSASDDDYSQALSRALRLINYAERSKSELQKRLTEDTYPSDTIRKVLQRLQELGLQSDARYAELYVKGKWRTSKHSPQRLTYDLSRQGISKDIIATALECTFGSRQGLGTPWHQQDDTDDNQEGEFCLVWLSHGCHMAVVTGLCCCKCIG